MYKCNFNNLNNVYVQFILRTLSFKFEAEKTCDWL